MTSIGTALRLKPSSRKILAHLEARGSISPMEALSTYGNTRLAASIWDLREAGVCVATMMKQDEAGHKYARYEMVGARH